VSEDLVERADPVPAGVRVGRVSVRWRPWAVAVTAVLVAATVLLFCLSVGTGEFSIGVGDVVATLLGGGSRLDSFVITGLRLPRALVALVVGLALGVSGALTQSIARNPLASPDVLGITAGAGTVAVLLVTATAGTAGAIAGTLTGTLGLPAAALAGGLGTGLLVYFLAWRRGIDGFRLVLIGVAISAVMQAVTTWLLVTADIRDVARAQAWLVGSLDGRTWSDVWPALVGAAVLLGVVAAVAFQLAPLHLGDDVAAGLGVRLGAVRAVLLLCAVLLAALAVSAAGPVPFVALVAPQVAMRLLRLPTPPLVASGVVGALLLLGADLVARLLPLTLPVGVVTAAVGGPFLVYLLVRANLRGTTS
jgi:iron complex transport system permease protein